MDEELIVLRAVTRPEPGSRNLLLLMEGQYPALEGPGNLTYVCGNGQCGARLVQGVYLSGVVIKCPKCHRYGEAPELPL